MVKYGYVLIVFLVVINLHCSQAEDDGVAELPEGHPQHCKFLFKGGDDMHVLGVLPGIGWDNLRNIFMDMVVDYEYKTCTLTEDEMYLIPDGIFTIPTKESQVDVYAEVFEKWSSYKSAWSASINAQASYRNIISSVSGSFSVDVKRNKQRQVSGESVTTRVQIRHRLYKVLLRSRLTLNRAFKSLVIEIGNTLANGDNALAEYLADTLVRDYGTHVLTTVDAGGAIIQESQIKRTLMTTYSINQLSAMATASASFLRGRISAMVSLEARINKESMDSFQSSTTNSHIASYGGNIYKTDVDDWESGIKENLVAIDKNGEPLHTIITTKNIDNLPPLLVRQVSLEVESAISRYYEMNTITGCTDSLSLNFNFLANKPNDISNLSVLCTTGNDNNTQFRFGGVFTRCKPPSVRNSRVCSRHIRNNPKTNADSCPTNYDEILIIRESKEEVFTVNGRRTAYFAEISVYWCALRKATVEKEVNVFDYFKYFGGMYTSMIPNPLTMARQCPKDFMPLPFGIDLNVCVSDTTDSQVEFGGFFTCKVGNPFAIESTSSKQGRPNSDYPKHCPKGFESHTSAIKEKCHIRYCIKYKSELKRYFNTATPENLIKRPPYIPLPQPFTNATNTMTFSDEGYIWKKDEITGEWRKEKETSALSGFLAASPPPNAASSQSAGFLAAVLLLILLHHHHCPIRICLELK